ncbi:MAG: amidoligase family protein [Deltaproteobacteria bacterium]|nr:amidoligase family protein [Deltaproteobacteria bacterium]
MARSFGIEIETFHPTMSRAQVAEKIRETGVNCREEGYNHATRTWWKIVTDCSVHGTGTEMEVVSPVLSGDAGIEQLQKVLECLTAIGCRVNRTTGLHVHADARDLTLENWKKLVADYRHYEPVTDSFMPTSRRAQNNRFCKSLRSATTYRAIMAATTMNELCYCLNNDRYHKLNLQSYTVHGTVEFRQHSGTVEAAKVLPWLRLCLALVEKSKAPAAADVHNVTVTTRGKYRPVIQKLVSEGLTLAEAKEMTGAKNPSFQIYKAVWAMGLDLKTTRENGTVRYHLTTGNAEGAPAAPERTATLAGLMRLASLAAADVAYFTLRASTFAEAA